MPRKHDDIWSGRVWALAVAVTFTAGCPGYLEERAWLADSGLLPPSLDTASPPPTGSGGTGGSPLLPGTGGSSGGGGSTGSGGAMMATGGTGGGVAPGTGGSGGVVGGDGGVRSDAVVRGDGGGSADMGVAMAQGCSAPAEINSKILMPRCAVCHGVNMPAGGLDLASAGVKGRILNKPSLFCNMKPLATADGNGHFFDKLNGPIAGCGSQMPFGGIMPLDATQVQCLKDWIKAP
jgi:hypothetical protein